MVTKAVSIWIIVSLEVPLWSMGLTRHATVAATRRILARRPAHRLGSSSSKPISEHQPLCLGYVAGIQSQSSCSADVPWNTFDEAYSLLQQVDPVVLYEFESNLWHQDGMKIIHSTKEISVLDIAARPGISQSVRSLVFNRRPELIQSSIEIEHVGAGPKLVGAPPPLVGLAATHLGGLALAVPLWLGCADTYNSSNKDEAKGNEYCIHRPLRVVVIGAGGCAVPAVLAKAGCKVTAIEPSDDVRTAAIKYFGALDVGIELVAGYGEGYLTERGQKESSLDILIIDAEDGKSAPPASMKEESFWKDTVIPSLESGAVVAINVIAHADERLEFQRIVDEAMPLHDVWYCNVPSVAEVSDRHEILFVTPAKDNGRGVNMAIVKKILGSFNYVDKPSDWTKELEHARAL